MPGEWRDPGDPEHAIMARAAIAMNFIWVTVCRSHPGYFVSAFADVLGRGSLPSSDAEFEADMISLVEGIRLTRANAQAEGAVKS